MPNSEAESDSLRLKRASGPPHWGKGRGRGGSAHAAQIGVTAGIFLRLPQTEEMEGGLQYGRWRIVQIATD